MRGLYTAGVLDVMMEQHFMPDVVCGTSAGVTFGVNLLSQQRSNNYHYHMVAYGFEEIKSGECFVLNVNHLRSKQGTDEESNAKRMVNIDSLLVMQNKIEQEQLFGDADILLFGDHNYYTQEQPIQTLIRAGYEDVLMRYNSTGYSYVYHSEKGYLGRAFASPIMATQVKAVHPYHLNADYFYSVDINVDWTRQCYAMRITTRY